MKPNPYRFKDYPEMEQEKPALVGDIAAEFRDDHDSAMQHYSRKRMYIEGVVTYAGPDMFGLPSLELSDRANGENDALCVFNDESSIQDVLEGDTVTVLANFIDCVPDYGPTFKKCEIVDKH